MNTTKYVRSTNYIKNPYTKISNSIAKLPAPEAGIMFQILSNSDDWVINKEVVRERSGLGKDRFRKAWNHLKELGYITRRIIPSQNGQFCHHYTIYEIPEVQNPSSEIDKPSMDNRSTETHTMVTGTTNNNQVINEDQKTILSSGSDGLSTEVEVRPGNNNTGPNILGLENTTNEELQIVPHPPLCFGGVRDNSKDQVQDPITKLPSQASKNTVPTSPVSNKNYQPEVSQDPISCEVYYSGKDEISPQTQDILDNLEHISDDVLINMIDGYYTKWFPNWEHLLRKKRLQGFVKETSKLVVPDTLATELLTEYNIRLRKEAYKKH